MLHDHWDRNGPPASTQPLAPSIVHHGSPVPTLPPASKTVRPQPRPTPRRVVPLPPPQEVVYETLPLPNPPQPALSQSDYPPLWQKYLDHALYYFLRNMVFTTPFPTATEAWATEVVVTAFKSWSCISTVPLSEASCKFVNPASPAMPLTSSSVNAHHPNFIALISKLPLCRLGLTPRQIMKSACSARGRFRDTILEFIYKTEELGITSNVSPTTIANHVQMLVSHNRFLDGPYPVSC